VILFNRGKSEKEVSARWEEIAYPNHLAAKARDLWAHKDVGSFTGAYSARVAPHSVVMVKITPKVHTNATHWDSANLIGKFPAHAAEVNQTPEGK
jgi:hypothetical protein